MASLKESVPRHDHTADAPHRDTALYDRKSRTDTSADAITEWSLAKVYQDQQVQEKLI